jgi:hypothetical protein
MQARPAPRASQAEYFLRNRNITIAQRLDRGSLIETISNNPRLPSFHWREHLSGPIAVHVLTHFRLLTIAAATLAVACGGQALAFWPFGGSTRIALSPAYGGVCEDCDLSGRILAGAKMSNSVFNGANFSNAVLTRADARATEFVEANFTDADLTFVNFTSADVTDATFLRANISGADLAQAHGLTQAQLNQACGDTGTSTPRGLRVQVCD